MGLGAKNELGALELNEDDVVQTNPEIEVGVHAMGIPTRGIVSLKCVTDGK